MGAFRQQSAIDLELSHARPANSRFSVDTFTFSPCLWKSGTRISRPVSSLADLVTLPLDISPLIPGSVSEIFSSTKMGRSRPMGFPLYLKSLQISESALRKYEKCPENDH